MIGTGSESRQAVLCAEVMAGVPPVWCCDRKICNVRFPLLKRYREWVGEDMKKWSWCLWFWFMYMHDFLAWKYWPQTSCLEYQKTNTALINLRSKYTVTEAFNSTNQCFFPQERFRHLICYSHFSYLDFGKLGGFKTSRVFRNTNPRPKIFHRKNSQPFFFRVLGKLSPHFSIEALMDWWKNPRGFSFSPPSSLTWRTIASLENHHFCQQEIQSTHSGWIFHCRVRLYPSKLENLDDHISPTSRWWWSFYRFGGILGCPVTGLLGSTGDRIDGFFHLEYL